MFLETFSADIFKDQLLLQSNVCQLAQTYLFNAFLDFKRCKKTLVFLTVVRYSEK